MCVCVCLALYVCMFVQSHYEQFAPDKQPGVTGMHAYVYVHPKWTIDTHDNTLMLHPYCSQELTRLKKHSRNTLMDSGVSIRKWYVDAHMCPTVCTLPSIYTH